VTLTLALEGILALMVVAAAAWSVFAQRSFAASVAFVTLGLLLTIVWVQLGAVDVALTEAALGSGLTGVLLLSASACLRGTAAEYDAPVGAGRKLLAAVGCALVTAGLAYAVLNPTEPAPTLAPAALASLPALQLGNPVTAVLMGYRAIDTMLEVVVLLLALVGVWSLTPDRFWGGRPGMPALAQADGVLPYFGKVLAPLGLVLGVYIFWIGSDAPGGEFQSASVLAAMWLMMVMAGVRDAPPIGNRHLRGLIVIGPLVFITIAFAGIGIAGAFLGYPADHAKTTILLIEVPLTLSLATMLALLVMGPPGREAA
jgi:multisubunit Na+/H+ antiporter MnhB subunit